MQRRRFLRSVLAVSAAVAAPRVAAALPMYDPFSPQPDRWRTFDLTTTIELARANGPRGMDSGAGIERGELDQARGEPLEDQRDEREAGPRSRIRNGDDLRAVGDERRGAGHRDREPRCDARSHDRFQEARHGGRSAPGRSPAL